MSKAATTTYFEGECRNCGRQITHRHVGPIETNFNTNRRIRVRCAECDATNTLDRK